MHSGQQSRTVDDLHCHCCATRYFSIENILNRRPKSIAARPLSGDCMLHLEEVVVGTINELKGL